MTPVASSSLLVDQNGVAVRLGAKLGTGGEGSVFAVARRELVAKLYHQPLGADHGAKLLSMVNCCNDALRTISAWPVAVLYGGRNGPVRGFLMPRLERYEAVHNVYGPAHRKARFPRADWAFLIQVARNLAAAFDTIHAQGHVIGDVNQGNVFVAANAMVKLIDCDSFQVESGAGRFLCDVGVPHFTAPELQHAQSFHALSRTAHHDNFGLAVLIFHLLFMGRHPFAGVYTGGTDMPIERAIKEFRYAFARDARARGMRRPPGSVGPELVTPEVSELFEQAFREASGAIARPTARDWLQALERLKGGVRSCATEVMHRYCGKLVACPWCDLEVQGVLYFLGMVSVSMASPASFDLQATWRAIEASRLPVYALPVLPAGMTVTPAPLPPDILKSKVWRNATAVVVFIVVALVTLRLPFLVPVWTTLGFWVWRTLWRHDPLTREREGRGIELRLAEQRWEELERKWQELSDAEGCRQKLAALLAAKHEYKELEAAYLRAKEDLEQRTRERQLQQYLARFHIDDAALEAIGASHRATLASFGIETAADIERSLLARLPGFGRHPSAELLTWRQGLEAQFRFDASRAVDPDDAQALTRRFAQRRNQLIKLLDAGPAELRAIAAVYEAQRRALLPGAQVAAQRLAQARADLSVL